MITALTAINDCLPLGKSSDRTQQIFESDSVEPTAHKDLFNIDGRDTYRYTRVKRFNTLS